MLIDDRVSGIGPVKDHRGREKGVLVYPVYSRRSGGLSVGINLFPGGKTCSFDCPYCEVFPFANGEIFSQDKMEEDLRGEIAAALERNIPVKDICFSGNGESTVSPDFPEALERAARVRADMAGEAELVLITNGSGLLDDTLFSLLRDAAAGPLNLDVWLKVDAGTPDWYRKMNRSSVPFDRLTARIKEFAASAPFTVQTMICAVDGEGPPPAEAEAWEKLLLDLARAAKDSAAGGKRGLLRKVQIYGKARPSPEDPETEALPVERLNERAASLRAVLTVAFEKEKYGAGISVPKVEVYP